MIVRLEKLQPQEVAPLSNFNDGNLAGVAESQLLPDFADQTLAQRLESHEREPQRLSRGLASFRSQRA